jgi:hypothetical protein
LYLQHISEKQKRNTNLRFVIILMLYLIASFFFLAVASNICFGQGWDPSKFSYNPGPNYELVWKDEFENVGPSKAIIDG